MPLLFFRGFDWFDVPALGFAALAGLSFLWATDPWGVLPPFLHITALVFVFMAARRLESFTPFLWAASLGLLAVLISAFFHPAYQGGFGNENFTTMFIIAALPLAVAVGGWAWVPVAGSVVYILADNGSRLELAAFAGWLACWFLFTPWTRRKWLALGCTSIGFAAVAWAMLHRDMTGLQYRWEMWQAAWAMFMDSPFLGRGLGGFETDFLYFAPPKQTVVYWTVFGPGSAHGDYLQVLAEFGGAGLLLAMGCILPLRAARPMWAWYCLFGLGAVALVDAPFQLPAPALIAVVALGALLAAKTPVSGVSAGISILAAVGLTWGAGMALYGQAALAPALATYKDEPIASHLLLEESLWRWPYDKQARFMIVFAALRSGVDDAALKRAKAAAMSAYPGHPFITREFKK